ncbi:MAG TPA: hypothetical protein VMG35_08855 [Bryobacteraceae bacterium]|nr:hypothetical protein [Bryobacteraceae bacterium]
MAGRAQTTTLEVTSKPGRKFYSLADEKGAVETLTSARAVSPDNATLYVELPPRTEVARVRARARI